MKKKSTIAIVIVAIVLIALPVILYIKDNLDRRKYENYKSTSSNTELNSFNQQWISYEGAQGGNNVKALLQKLIANCNINQEEEQRLVDVYCSRPTEDGNPETIYITVENCSLDSESSDSTVGKIINLRNQIEPRHTYYVSMEYVKNNPYVNRIIIKYESDDNGPSD